MCLDTPKRKSGVAVGSKNQGEDGKRRPPRLYKATYKATLSCSTSLGNAATPKYEIWKNWPQCAVAEGTPAVVGHRPPCDLEGKSPPEGVDFLRLKSLASNYKIGLDVAFRDFEGGGMLLVGALGAVLPAASTTSG